MGNAIISRRETGGQLTETMEKSGHGQKVHSQAAI